MADQGSEGILSPFLRKKRIAAARPFLIGRVLDVGCGSGSLADIVKPSLYYGVDIDSESLDCARNKFPDHHFENTLPLSSEKFETVVSLAVIEHIQDPGAFLLELSCYLDDSPNACIVITTPHPSVDWVHEFGAKIGLFSSHANEEHEELLDRNKLNTAGKKAGLNLRHYKKFLFGANQIAIFVKEHR